METECLSGNFLGGLYFNVVDAWKVCLGGDKNLIRLLPAISFEFELKNLPWKLEEKCKTSQFKESELPTSLIINV